MISTPYHGLNLTSKMGALILSGIIQTEFRIFS
jgi:hypothetical protein